MRPGERGTAAEQLANLRRAVAALEPLLAEDGLVITHGNGPQVGNELLRQERAAEEAPPLPLWLAVAQTQAEIGALIAAELRPVVERAVACVLTHVRVAPDDPAFDRPTKPIGPFYSEDQAEQLQRERGWATTADANRGHRRVVRGDRRRLRRRRNSSRAARDAARGHRRGDRQGPRVGPTRARARRGTAADPHRGAGGVPESRRARSARDPCPQPRRCRRPAAAARGRLDAPEDRSGAH